LLVLLAYVYLQHTLNYFVGSHFLSFCVRRYVSLDLSPSCK